MSEAYSVQKPVAIWNSARGVWEKPETANLFCEHLELFSETWQTSGMMRGGMVYELQKPEHPTSDSEFSYLRSPKASEGEGGALGEAEALRRGNTVGIRDQMMDLVAAQGKKVSRLSVPTPTATDGSWDRNKVQRRVTTDSMNRGVDLPLWAKRINEGTYDNSKATWGKFDYVVKRWENITGMKAPGPTKPDGKNGAHRLSSEFTEWMMGLRPGWVTGHGLSRKDELKACGNGVVPQQAELALQMLLEVDDV